MIKKLSIGILSLLGLNFMAQVVPNIDWVQYYSERNGISNVPSAIDASNNVYITGYTYPINPSNQDATTVKYDQNGVLQWVKNYDFGGTDNAKAIILDASGNVYVTGESDAVASGRDIITIKYDASGTQLWATRFTGAGIGTDVGNAITVDGSGNVYVTGYTTNSIGNRDYITLKYNSSGIQQFAVSFAGAGNQNDEAVAIGFNSNRLYVTGTSINSSSNADLVTLRINNNTGATMWTKSENGTSNSNDMAYALIADGNDVVVVGYINNTSTVNDYITVKYNGNNGNTLFNKTYDFANSNNVATAIVKDATGNYAVTGTSLNGTIYEYHTIMYNNVGTQQWVNIVSTGLTYSSSMPQIAVDPIANHFYVCGQKQGVNSDIFVYQITPTGNKTWDEQFNGAQNGTDAAVDLVVNSTGAIYIAGASLNSSAKFDYTTIKISQTPVYFPPDINPAEKPYVGHLFYENKGQILIQDSVKVAKEILFNSEMYPYSFYSTNRISYKFFYEDSIAGNNDTVQRIDINMVKANVNAKAYPFNPKQGTISHMEQGLPNPAIGVQGYERYFIPNIYPNIDLHYYSNHNGLKMYYIVKPGADPKNIVWDVNGSTSNSINGNNLEINSFKGKVVFDKPTVYSVNMSGNAIPITTTANWQNSGTNKYSINLTTYNSAMPLIIELDYGNPIATSISSSNNLFHCTYYGGYKPTGLKAMDIDKTTGRYVTLMDFQASQPGGTTFPTITGLVTSISSVTNTISYMLGIVLFDKDGQRMATNTYGLYGYAMNAMGICLNNNLITVIGNNNTPDPMGSSVSRINLPVYTSTTALSAGTYSSNKGDGYAIQFEFTPTSGGVGTINNIKWITRLNGYASDIAKTPDGKNLYITTSTGGPYTPPDLKVQIGSYNSSTATYGYFYQISKFDTLGVRKWATFYQAPNNSYLNNAPYNFLNVNTSLTNLDYDRYLKCKISCDKYGFSIAGECDTAGLKIYSKYGAPLQTNHSGKTDAFFARFNKKDTIIYSSYFGGSKEDLFTGIKNVNDNSTAVIGYCNSSNNLKITTNPNGTEFIDSSNTFNSYKMYIAKFDTVGNKTWATFYGKVTIDNIFTNALAVDQKENLYVSGREVGGATYPAIANPSNVYNDFYIYGNVNTESNMIGFNKNNQIIWNTRFGGHYEDLSLNMLFNPVNSRLILGGTTNSSYGRTAPSSNPSFPIYKQFSTPSTVYYQDESGNISGSLYPNVFPYNAFLATFDNSQFIIGIDEYYKDKNNQSTFDVFPNPTNNNTNLAFKNELRGDIKIQVFNEIGQLVYETNEKNILKYSLINLNTQSLSNGIYIINVLNDSQSYSKKLIITK